MSRNASSNETNDTSALAPMNLDEDSGAFRLDAMSPGSEAAAEFGTRKPRATLQIAFFGVLIVAAAGVVFAMRGAGMGPLKSVANVEVPDYDVTKPHGTTGEQKRILDDLSRAFTTVQVPVEQVQKNPFLLADALAPVPESTQEGDPSEAQRLAAERRAKQDAENRQKHIEGRLSTMTIHAILRGTNPVARVNQEVVRVGDTLEEEFLVKAINDRSVELEADGVTYMISLDEPPTKKGARRKK